MKYYVKAMEPIGYNSYRTIILRSCDDLERAFDLAFELRSETGLNCFVDFEK